MKTTRGFTLIELMIVVAIIAILSTIAITVYNNSTGKAELSEAFTVVDALKSDVVEYYNQNGSCPSNGSDGIASAASYSGKYVASASVSSAASGCQITALMRSSTVSAKLRGKTVSFTMSPAGDGTFQWTCSSDAPAIVVPRACQ
jgi:type IV pilus assembly protein PilA